MDMTEDEKRAAALAFMKAEQERMSGGRNLEHSEIVNAINTSLDKTVRRTVKQQELMDSLSQQGITWDDLKAAYDESFALGHAAMLDFKLAYFYAGSAIAVHERYNTSPDQCADLIYRVLDAADEYPDKDGVVAAAKELTGVDTAVYDTDCIPTPPGRARMPANAKITRKDEKAIARMKKSGITEADLYSLTMTYANRSRR